MELMNWLGAHETIAGTLLGTVLGAFLSLGVTYLSHWRRNARQQRAAQMCVANDLRHWMNGAAERISDTANHMSSDGHAGHAHTSLPEFRFEVTTGKIALLDSRSSLDVFELIHKKDGVNSEIASILEFQADEDQMLNVFRGRSAKLLLEALAIYEHVCRQLGWSARAFHDGFKDDMRREVERLAQNEAKEAAANRAFWVDTEATATPPRA